MLLKTRPPARGSFIINTNMDTSTRILLIHESVNNIIDNNYIQTLDENLLSVAMNALSGIGSGISKFLSLSKPQRVTKEQSAQRESGIQAALKAKQNQAAAEKASKAIDAIKTSQDVQLKNIDKAQSLTAGANPERTLEVRKQVADQLRALRNQRFQQQANSIADTLSKKGVENPDKIAATVLTNPDIVRAEAQMQKQRLATLRAKYQERGYGFIDKAQVAAARPKLAAAMYAQKIQAGTQGTEDTASTPSANLPPKSNVNQPRLTPAEMQAIQSRTQRQRTLGLSASEVAGAD